MVFPILKMAAGLGTIVALTACVAPTGKLPSELHAKPILMGQVSMERPGLSRDTKDASGSR